MPFKPGDRVRYPTGKTGTVLSAPTAAVTIVDPVNGIHSARRSLSYPER